MSMYPCLNPLNPIYYPVVVVVMLLLSLLASPAAGMTNSLPAETAIPPDSIRKGVIDRLVADGTVGADPEHVYFFVLGDVIETNGKTLRGGAYDKYVAFLKAAGLEQLDRWGFYQTDGRIAFQGVADGYEHYDCIQHYRSKTSRFPAAEESFQPGASVSMN